MIFVGPAQTQHIDDLVDLESALFAEDSGRHEPFADVTWPRREARRDFERLIGESRCIVLVAHADAELVGHLVGYMAESSPTRQPVTYAVLRSMYVRAALRHTGVGSSLVARFIEWAEHNDCVEVHVDSYAANDQAQQFYEQHGFAVRSIARVRPL